MHLKAPTKNRAATSCFGLRNRITSAGARELADWLRSRPSSSRPPRDELVIKVLFALEIPGIDMPRDHAEAGLLEDAARRDVVGYASVLLIPPAREALQMK